MIFFSRIFFLYLFININISFFFFSIIKWITIKFNRWVEVKYDEGAVSIFVNSFPKLNDAKRRSPAPSFFYFLLVQTPLYSLPLSAKLFYYFVLLLLAPYSPPLPHHVYFTFYIPLDGPTMFNGTERRQIVH